MGGRIEEKNNSGYTCYTGKRIEEKTMATLVTWEGELEKKQWPHLENWSAPVDAEKHLLR